MGIIIINGKKYDSSTGMMLSRPTPDDFADLTSPAIEFDQKAQSPDWLENYVDTNQAESEPAAKATAEPARVSEDAKRAESSDIEVESTATPEIEWPDDEKSNPAPMRARRAIGESKTLNRRFVKKPLGNSGQYAESIAIKSIKARAATPVAAQQVAQASSPTTVPVRAVRSTGSLSTPAVRRWSEPKARKLNDESIDNDIAELAKVLQNEDQFETAGWKNNKKSRPARQKAIKSKRRTFKLPAIMATTGAMAAVAGMAFYMLSPAISIRVAASKAGIDGRNPYTPAGYSINGEVAYKPGQITINYKNGDGKTYSVTQQAKSSGTTDSMRNEISLQNSGNYHEVKTDSAQVIMYGNKASWIKNGIMYTINGSSSLDKMQITNIVDSM